MKKIDEVLMENPYKGYIYSYPHKKAYSNFDEKISLKSLWGKVENKDLTLYIHIPFCKNKCGYCNLFSSTMCNTTKVTKYIEKLTEELAAIKEILKIKDENIFSSVIFGGGTPTILSIDIMENLLSKIKDILNIDFSKVFFSIETSPRTLNKKYMALLKKYYINRISIGIQSFHSEELIEINRHESLEEINNSLELLFKDNIDIRNIDLIYGMPSQTIESFLESLKKTLSYKPEEIYLYPLYIRENTNLYKNHVVNSDKMISMYEKGREYLISKGYIQTSMRNFIREDMVETLYPSYSCQENKMIGVGCGARSYIGNIHYSRNYSVIQSRINQIIDDYINEKDFSNIGYGYILSIDESKRKYVLKSILKVTGLDIDMYEKEFQSSIFEDFNEISQLIEGDYLIIKGSRITPTEKGLKYSDSIGEIFISDEVKMRTSSFME